MISAFGVEHGEISKGMISQAYQDRKTLAQAQRRMKKDPAYKQQVRHQMAVNQVTGQLAKNPNLRQTGPRSFEKR